MDLPTPRELADGLQSNEAKETAKLLGIMAGSVAFYVAVFTGLHALCGRTNGGP